MPFLREGGHCAATGRYTVIVVPSPSWVSTPMSPPHLRTIRRLAASRDDNAAKRLSEPASGYQSAKNACQLARA